MAPYARWALPSFKTILVNRCDDYLNSSDRGTDKARSKLITEVAKDITDIAQQKEENIPDDLEKCVRTWFGNYASGNGTEERPEKPKSDTRGHPTSTKSWTAKSACGQLFTNRISDEQKRLSDGGEKDIGKYRAALSNVFEQLSEAELKQCEDSAVEWNTKPLPDELQRKLSRTIPTEVSDFLKFIKHRTGASFIAFAAYTNEEGEQTYARYETEGLDFFATRKEHRKGTNNIVDIWKDFNIEITEAADSKEALECDDDYYPQLPNNTCELRLHRRKAILRQFMAAARAFYKLTGRIPWLDIAENPSHHLSKQSQPDSDHKLEEPSRMKSDGVDAWLRHWLKLQKKGRRPLVLKDPTSKSSELIPRSRTVTKRKASKGKARYIETDESDDQDTGNKSDSEETEEPARGEGPGNALVLSPFSASATRKTRRAFLASLSNDMNYKKLQLLLYAAKNGDLLEESPPAWVTWESNDNYLPAAFYDTKSTSSLSALSAFARWVGNDPITADGNTLASYDQVELVALAFGLAFRALWVAQFPGRYSDVPPYILNGSYPFSEYEQLSHKIENIISGYIDTLQELEAAYPTWNSSGKASTSQETSASAGGEKGKKRADKRPPGLANVPASLLHLREEVALAGERWESLGEQWRSLAALWLRAEGVLSKSGRTNLSFTQIRKASIPEEWKEWMNAKLMKIDAKRPSDKFGKVFTDYLNGLLLPASDIGATVMAAVWCRPGQTGILGLLLCLYWQAEYSGGGNDWQANMKRVEGIFSAIVAEPTLQRAKRSRAASGGSAPSKRKRS